MPLSVSKSKQFNSLENIKLIEAILNMQPITQNDFQSIMKEKFRDKWLLNAKPGITNAYTAIVKLTNHFSYFTINLANVSDKVIKLHPSIFLFKTPVINDKPIEQSNSILESTFDSEKTITIQNIILDKLKRNKIFKTEFDCIVANSHYFDKNLLIESSKMYLQIQECAPYIFHYLYSQKSVATYGQIEINDVMKRFVALTCNMYLLLKQ